MRKGLSFLLALALLLMALTPPALAVTPDDYQDSIPQVLEQDHLYATAAVLLDGVSGRLLFTKNPRIRMYPASTTKIMTVMLALESGIPLDTPVIVPQQAAKIPTDSTLVPVFPGDQLPFIDLLYGCMLASGNDAANAVAVLVAGSIEAFVERMNKRAQELGCTDTHFANAHGYHDVEHYTTALDLARITQAALNIDTFREIASTERYTFTIHRDGEDITPTRANTNLLLNPESRYYYENCIGVKTGTHSMAGNCFVGASERDGVRLVAVALNCAETNQKWVDAIRMLNFGYTRYNEVTMEQLFAAAGDKIGTLQISNAQRGDPQGGVLSLRIARISNPDYIRMVAADVDGAMEDAVADFISRTTMTITHNMVAPVSEGEIMGNLRYVGQSGEVINALLIASRSVKAQPARMSVEDMFPFMKSLGDPLVRALLIVLLCLIVMLIVANVVRGAVRQRERGRIYQVRKREELRAERAENRRRRERARQRREEVLRERREKWERRNDDRDYEFIYDEDEDDDDYDLFAEDDEYDNYDDYDD
ncbi:MAG: D-alanyl-D-alanine carboxypeptidase [Clostridia bacterium]|nr:D-alanyl-D-alanine carboxypeptidase [Clostridia bacterium]